MMIREVTPNSSYEEISILAVDTNNPNNPAKIEYIIIRKVYIFRKNTSAKWGVSG